MKGHAATLLIVATMLPAAAQAQSRQPFVAIGGGVQAAGRALSDRFEFEQYQEHATVDVDYPSPSGAMINVGGGLRVWRKLGMGVAVTSFTARSTAGVEARIPHPFHFDRLRPVSGSQSGTDRRETAVHVQVRYPIVATDRLQITASAGPSLFNAEQELITGVEIDESFPFDEASFRRADTRRARGFATGFNAGTDAVWLLGRRFGIGATIRFVRGGVNLDASGGRTIGVDAGGVQGGIDLRLFF